MAVILGINAGFHDSAACLVVDGRVVGAIAEERCTRRKHDGSFPESAIASVLKTSGLGVTDVDLVCSSWDYMRFEADKLLYHLRRGIETGQTEGAEAGLAYLHNLMRYKTPRYEAITDVERRARSIFPAPFLTVEHHRAHAYSTFPFAPFQTDTAILIVDGSGERESASIWITKGTGILPVKSIPLPHSIGVFYGAITQYLGFTHHDEEWKVMGWAPYGRPLYHQTMRDNMLESLHSLNLEYFQHQSGHFPWYSSKLQELLDLPPRDSQGDFDQVYADVAASAQAVAEDMILALARDTKELTGARHLCMAGGVALNGKANGRILSEGLFESLFVQPASADDGTAIGAALWGAAQLGDPIHRPLRTVYLGSASDDADCHAALDRAGLSGERLEMDELCAQVAAELAQGKVVGWFVGRSEFGPRALGNRSILADPRRAEMKDVLNAKIKFREHFRPFAPAVLAERAPEFFEGRLDNAIFMNQIFRATEHAAASIPAAVHADGTSRVQVVEPENNPAFHRLISEFEKLSGVPVLINTSFNVKGEPIVENAADAVRCFLNTGIDILVLNNFIVKKN